jgi:mono/diheme cytochrome c family protein
MQQLAIAGSPPPPQAPLPLTSPGSAIYAARCAGCHGADGEGKKQRVISIAPYRYEVSGDLTISTAAWVHDRNKFSQIVVQGMPGRIMPGQATLTSAQIDELYEFVRSLVRTR